MISPKHAEQAMWAHLKKCLTTEQRSLAIAAALTHIAKQGPKDRAVLSEAWDAVVRQVDAFSGNMPSIDVTRPEHVYLWSRFLWDLLQEELWLIPLNTKNKITRAGAVRVSKGSASHTIFQARDVMREALLREAVAFILVHNHPTGDHTPSPQDIEVTRTLRDSAQVLGVPLLDHVVVSKEGFTSILDFL